MYGTITADVLKELRAACPRVSTDMEDRILYSFDATRAKRQPDAVAFPSTTEEVAGLVKVCAKHRIPITPRGAGTGMAGGSVPVEGGLELALTMMDRILSLNKEGMYVEVQPGVVNKALGDHLAKENLFYPPDPASLKSSTIGGNVATGAGGPSAVKYGVTGDYVMGMTVVLANGEIMETGIKTEKGVVGYDLKRLLVGSEGTLGVITAIRLKVVPLPEHVATATAVFPDRADAVRAVTAILAAGAKPRTLEYIDRTAIQCVEQYVKAGLPVDAGAMLLIETDGKKDEAEREMAVIQDVCARFATTRFTVAQTKTEAEEQWKVRRSISPSLPSLRPTKINEDITVPRNRIAELMERLDALSEETGLPIVNFGHAGDGNIHVNVMTDKASEKEYRLALKTIDRIFDLTLELDGTLSGEHGVGLSKQSYVPKELSQAVIDASRAIKKALDPNNIMNPGKLFPPCDR